MHFIFSFFFVCIHMLHSAATVWQWRTWYHTHIHSETPSTPDRERERRSWYKAWVDHYLWPNPSPWNATGILCPAYLYPRLFSSFFGILKSLRTKWKKQKRANTHTLTLWDLSCELAARQCVCWAFQDFSEQTGFSLRVSFTLARFGDNTIVSLRSSPYRRRVPHTCITYEYIYVPSDRFRCMRAPCIPIRSPRTSNSRSEFSQKEWIGRCAPAPRSTSHRNKKILFSWETK